MQINRFLSITFIALKTQKTRTLLASLGVMIGIASVIVMVAIGKGSQQEVMEVIAGMGENLITINAGEMKRRGGRLRLTGNVTTLTPRDARELMERVDVLVKSAPFHSAQLQVKFGNAATETLVAGSTPDFLRIRNYEISQGEFFTEKDLKLSARVAVIGQTTVQNIFGEEEALGRTFRINAVPFKIIGIFAPKGLDTNGMDQDDILLIPITTLMRRILNTTYIDTIYAKADSKKHIDRAIMEIREVLRRQHKLGDNQKDDFTIISQLDLEDLKKETSELFTRLIVGVAAISLVVGGIGILAVMLISVKERTREIGTRRAVGASRTDIIRQFLLESVLVGLLGGGIGVALGVGITLGLTRWGPWTLILDGKTVFLATGICIVIGMVFGIYPALKASRLDPMEALTIE
ncbi:MAG: ABC transporter permease [Nitrospinaceae bacterium]